MEPTQLKGIIMAHFAELENNIVIRVTVVDNKDILDENGQESEQKGIEFCTNLLGGTWKQTSYNTQAGQHTLGGTPFRKNYAGIGFTYDEARDAFISPKPYNSWLLNETTCNWIAPVDMPDDIKNYDWDEATTSWVKIVLEE